MPKESVQLVEVVELTSVNIFANSVAQVRALIQQKAISTLGSNRDEFTNESWELLFELVAYSLHLADRIAFNAVGPEKRSRFMDALDSSVSSNLAQANLTDDATSEARQQFQSSFLSFYGERSAFYAPLQLPSGGKAPLQGTLFWEAAKVAADAHFPDDATGATLILSISFSQCMNGVEDLGARLTGVRDF